MVAFRLFTTFRRVFIYGYLVLGSFLFRVDVRVCLGLIAIRLSFVTLILTSSIITFFTGLFCLLSSVIGAFCRMIIVPFLVVFVFNPLIYVFIITFSFDIPQLSFSVKVRIFIFFCVIILLFFTILTYHFMLVPF